MELTELCKSAKEVSRQIGNLDTNTKNEVLRAAAEALVAHTDEIIRENEKDLARGRENHMPEGLLDRLMLNPSRLRIILLMGNILTTDQLAMLVKEHCLCG